MSTERITYYRYTYVLKGLIDQYRNWLNYIAKRKGVSISSFKVNRTEDGEELILEFNSSDKETLNKIFESATKFKNTIMGRIKKEGFSIKIGLRKEETEDGIKVVIAFILPFVIMETLNRIQDEIEKQLK